MAVCAFWIKVVVVLVERKKEEEAHKIIRWEILFRQKERKCKSKKHSSTKLSSPISLLFNKETPLKYPLTEHHEEAKKPLYPIGGAAAKICPWKFWLSFQTIFTKAAYIAHLQSFFFPLYFFLVVCSPCQIYMYGIYSEGFLKIMCFTLLIHCDCLSCKHKLLPSVCVWRLIFL